MIAAMCVPAGFRLGGWTALGRKKSCTGIFSLSGTGVVRVRSSFSAAGKAGNIRVTSRMIPGFRRIFRSDIGRRIGAGVLTGWAATMVFASITVGARSERSARNRAQVWIVILPSHNGTTDQRAFGHLLHKFSAE